MSKLHCPRPIVEAISASASRSLPCRLPLPEVEFPEGNRSVSPIAARPLLRLFKLLSKQLFQSQYCLSVKHCQVADGLYLAYGFAEKKTQAERLGRVHLRRKKKNRRKP
jgi:hypothetical protein